MKRKGSQSVGHAFDFPTWLIEVILRNSRASAFSWKFPSAFIGVHLLKSASKFSSSWMQSGNACAYSRLLPPHPSMQKVPFSEPSASIVATLAVWMNGMLVSRARVCSGPRV